ncbi:hypothetical protein WOLCODRAFT_159055 [Wolfiporia cocos MD-104 SS10]|uniref:Uncharacterized protein n=1 Tax=Wolfiporia cocos (strain MD-104) TaxID=742152 RepID=A0A2H3JI10_WOLCO|nr:hypothetical protein WOLCODRAFT_159055 [Wolfiporia cocos MD-104 SS10]
MASADESWTIATVAKPRKQSTMVSYRIIPGTMYETHKVTTVYRPEVGKHTWPGEQTCLMDYLRVVFGIRVNGTAVTTFNSIPPHIRPFINANHTTYIKYYNEDSTLSQETR